MAKTAKQKKAARRLALWLINEDLAHNPIGAIEHDGGLAAAGWREAAACAGDTETVRRIDAVGIDDLADAWGEIIDLLLCAANNGAQ